MSQFSKQTFDTAKYLSFRPSYSSSFYDLTYRYHAARGGKFGTALDIGCGPYVTPSFCPPAQELMDRSIG